MQQDSLHHAVPESVREMTSSSSDTVHKPRFQFKRTVAADTIKPDPKLFKPFPTGLPLTMKPEMLNGDYWSKGPIRIQKSEFAKRLDSITGTKDSLVTIKPTGIAGDPIPYLFRNDNFVTITLLISFFLVVWVISCSRYFLSKQVKDFFHERKRGNLFDERTRSELRGQIYLVFQTCFILGLLFFDFTQERQTEVFNQVSPYKILGMSVAIFALYYLLKCGTYAFVNSIFFDRSQNERWNEAYMLSILALGIALLPVTLLVVYFDLGFYELTILFFSILALDKTLLLYKCSRIFFTYPWGALHLFLYFCTLEIAPLFILFRALVYANSFLLTIN